MYKVFIKQSSITFIKSDEFDDGGDLSFTTLNSAKELYADIEKAKETRREIIKTTDVEKAWSDFSSNFRIIEAAGGVVRNEKGEILFIFRLGCWDLPKGKIEEGEEIEEAAIREVEEECGIENLTISKRLPDTYHTYELRGDQILKRTYWFEMNTSFEGVLTPQLEEDITKVCWVKPNEMDTYMENTYSSIEWLLHEYQASIIS